jgi:hypothetical protein
VPIQSYAGATFGLDAERRALNIDYWGWQSQWRMVVWEVFVSYHFLPESGAESRGTLNVSSSWKKHSRSKEYTNAVLHTKDGPKWFAQNPLTCLLTRDTTNIPTLTPT